MACQVLSLSVTSARNSSSKTRARLRQQSGGCSVSKSKSGGCLVSSIGDRQWPTLEVGGNCPFEWLLKSAFED